MVSSVLVDFGLAWTASQELILPYGLKAGALMQIVLMLLGSIAEACRIAAGDYTIYTQPAAGAVTLIISREIGQFHTVYHPNLDLGRVRMTMAERSEPLELLTCSLTPDDDGGGTFALSRGDRDYSVSFARR